MIPPALLSSPSTILLGCGLPCFALVFLSAYAVVSSRYHCNYKLLELKLNECQIDSRLSEKEHALTVKTMNAQHLSLTSANEGMQLQLLALKKRNEELACHIVQKDAEYVQRRSELEDVWLKEREGILRAKDKETVSLQTNLRAVEAVSTAKSYQIQDLTKAKEELHELFLQQEQKNWELTDKLTECYRRLGSGDPFLGPLSQLLPMSSPPPYPAKRDPRVIQSYNQAICIFEK